MSDLWDVGNVGCRKCEVSEEWVIGGAVLSEIRTVGGIECPRNGTEARCRTRELSEEWVVGVVSGPRIIYPY